MRGWRSRGAPEVVVVVVVERPSRSSLEFETPPESRSPAAPPPRYVQTKKTSSTSTRPRRSTSRSSPRRRWVLTSPEHRSSLVIAATGRWGDTHPAHVFTHPLTHKPTHSQTHASPSSVLQALELLKCTHEGLTTAEAEKRLEEYGPNKLPEGSRNALLVYLGYMYVRLNRCSCFPFTRPRRVACSALSTKPPSSLFPLPPPAHPFLSPEPPTLIPSSGGTRSPGPWRRRRSSPLPSWTMWTLR